MPARIIKQKALKLARKRKRAAEFGLVLMYQEHGCVTLRPAGDAKELQSRVVVAGHCITLQWLHPPLRVEKAAREAADRLRGPGPCGRCGGRGIDPEYEGPCFSCSQPGGPW